MNERQYLKSTNQVYMVLLLLPGKHVSSSVEATFCKLWLQNAKQQVNKKLTQHHEIIYKIRIHQSTAVY